MATVRKKHAPYPWQRWFSKRKFKLVRGKHFDCQIHGMVAQVRSAAGKYRKQVHIEVVEATIMVTIL